MTKSLISTCTIFTFGLVPTVALSQTYQFDPASLKKYISTAAKIGSPANPDSIKVNQDLRQQGRCAAYAIKNLPNAKADGSGMALTAAFESDCKAGVGGLVLTLWKQSGESAWEIQNRWATISTHGNYQQLPDSILRWPHQIAEFQASFQRDQLDPFPSSKLPAWKLGMIMPDLPLGLAWRHGMERELYETVRANDYQVFCSYSSTLVCFANLPARGISRNPILVTDGYGDIYNAHTAAAALDVLLGKTPSLTPSEVAEKQKAGEEMVDKAARDAVAAAINQGTMPDSPTATEKATSQATTPPPKKR